MARLNIISALYFALLWIGTLASYYGNRDLLLVVYLILALVVFAVATKPAHATSNDDRFFQLLILIISLTLLFSSTSASSYLPGGDINQEFNLFLQVSRTGTWNEGNAQLYNGAVSISIFPSILSIVSKLDGIRIFKFIYPALFSSVPVLLFRIYRRILPSKFAFLSVFLFMAYPTFYIEMIRLGRQEIGEIFLVLLTSSLLSSQISRKIAGRILIVLLTVGLVTAHYSLAYIYLFVLFASYSAFKISRRFVTLATLITLMISAVVAVSWFYFVAAGTSLNSLIDFLSFVANGLERDFFNPTSRPLAVTEAIGLSSVMPGFLHAVNRGTQYLVVFLLALGFVFFIRKRSKSLAERQIMAPMTVGFVLLGFSVGVPFFAAGLDLTRTVHIVFLFVSPCFVYGARMLQSLLQKLYASIDHARFRMRLPFHVGGILLASILLSFFLFNSGWAWAVAMDRPTSLIFDGQRMLGSKDRALEVTYFVGFNVGQDVYAARWVGLYLPSTRLMCADVISSHHPLVSYGGYPTLLDRHGHSYFANLVSLQDCHFETSYVFWSTLNEIYGTETGYEIYYQSVTHVAGNLVTKSRLYSNGNAVVFG